MRRYLACAAPLLLCPATVVSLLMGWRLAAVLFALAVLGSLVGPPVVRLVTGMSIDTLDQAGLRGDLRAVRRMLGAGVDPDTSDPVGCTGLHFAAVRGHIEVVEALLEAGASINAETDDGWTPLDAAGLGGYPAVIALLRERGGEARAAHPPASPLADLD